MIDKEYLIAKGSSVIEYYANLHEADWLRMYLRGTVEHDVEIEAYDLDLSIWNGDSSFSYLNPKVVSIFYGVNIGLGAGIGFNLFIRGAATVANLIRDDQLVTVTSVLNMQHLVMVETESYPLIDEKFLKDYVDILSTALMQEETTTWRPFLSFVSGVYWQLSQIKVSENDAIVKEVREILLDRARKGLIEVF